MRILIHGINFSPELTGTGKYSGEMTEWLAAQGHEVRVVTAPPYYPQWRGAEGYSGARYKRESLRALRQAQGRLRRGSPGSWCLRRLIVWTGLPRRLRLLAMTRWGGLPRRLRRLMEQLVKLLAIPLSNQKAVAKWLVISPQAGKSLVIAKRGGLA